MTRPYRYRRSFNRGLYKAGKTIYSGAAAYGRINSTFTLLFTSFFGIMFILFGLSLLFKSKDKQIKATVVDISSDLSMCQKYSNDQKSNTSYVACVKFNIVGQDGQEINTEYLPVSNTYRQNETVVLYQNENGYSTTESSPKTTGAFLILLGLFCISMGYLSYRFAHESKTYAAIQGGTAIVNWFR